MPLQVSVGQFTSPVAPGLFPVAGLGFMPTAVFFYTTGRIFPAVTYLSGGMGASTGPSNSSFAAVTSARAPAPTARAMFDTSAVFVSIDVGGAVTVRQRAEMSSLDADGFTLNFTIADAAVPVYYIAFGSVQAHSDSFTLTTGAGSQDIVDPGFVPDVVLFYSSAYGVADSINTDMQQHFGFYDGTSEYSSSIYREEDPNPLQGRGGEDAAGDAIKILDNAGGVYGQASIQMLSQGFRVNKSVLPPADHSIGYLALKGVQTDFNTFTPPATPFAPQSVTGVGFMPQLVSCFGRYAGPAYTTGLNSNRFALGAYDGSVAGLTTAWNGHDGAPAENLDRSALLDAIFAIGIQDTFHQHLDGNSLDADGFTYSDGGPPPDANFPLEDVFFLAMAEGSNNNVVPGPKRGNRCTSAFAFLLSEYGICGTSTHPEASKVGCSCFHLSATNATEHDIEYDLGVDYMDDFEIADLLVIQDLRNFLRLEDPVTVRVQASDDALFGVFDEEVFVVGIGDLKGNESRSWCTELTAFPTMRRYWRVRIETTLSINPLIGSIALGKALRLEHSPAFPARFDLLDEFSQARRNPWQIRLEFQGIVEAQKQLFDERILNLSDVTPIWLYDGNDAVFFGKSIMRVVYTRGDAEMRSTGRDYNLSMRLEELP